MLMPFPAINMALVDYAEVHLGGLVDFDFREVCRHSKVSSFRNQRPERPIDAGQMQRSEKPKKGLGLRRWMYVRKAETGPSMCLKELRHDL